MQIILISKPCFVIYIITFLIYSLFSFRNISEIDVIENQLNPFIVAISSHDITIELIYNFFFVKMDWYVQTTLIMYTFFFISNVLISENTKEKKTKKICILTFLTTLYYIICYTYLYSPSQAHYYRNLWAFILGVFVAYTPSFFERNKLLALYGICSLFVFNYIQEGIWYASTAIAALFSLSCLGFGDFCGKINSHLLLFLGEISYPLYLGHRMFYNTLWATGYCIFPLFVVFAISFAVFYKYILEKKACLRHE